MSRTIVIDDPNAAAENRAAVEAMTGRNALPPGTVFLDQVATLTGTNNGAALLGKSTLDNHGTSGDWLVGSALAVRPANNGTACLSWRGDPRPAVVPPGAVGWHWLAGDGFELRVPTRLLPGQPVPAKGEYMQAHKGQPFTVLSAGFYSVALGHGLTIGQDVFVTDGVAINECVGEFRRIVAATSRTVTLDMPLIRTYTQPTFVAGPWPGRIAIDGFNLKGNVSTLVLQQAVDVTVSKVSVIQPATVSSAVCVIGCGRVAFDGCGLPSVGMSSGATATFHDCEIGSLKAEQGQIGVELGGCQLGWLDTASRCEKWLIHDCSFTGGPEQTLGIYDGWIVEDVRCIGTVRVRGRGATVADLRTNGVVQVQRVYQGAPPDAATNVTLDYVNAAYIELLPGTSGNINNCTCPVYCSDAATRVRWKRDGKPL